MDTYHQNFITAIRQLMADKPELDSVKAAAAYLGIAYMSIHKIMDGTNRPTADQGIILCNKGGFSANWLFLNKGEEKMADAATLVEIKKLMKKIEGKM